MPEIQEVPSTGSEGVDLTPEQNSGVLKKILREGSAEGHPAKGDTVYVHYVGTLQETGEKFDSSRDRGEEFSFPLGKGQVIKAWDIGVASMRKGELAQLICAPDYAYGSGGSPPKIPGGATLVFEVELFRWEGEDISPDRDRSITRSQQTEGEKYDTPNDGAHIQAHIIGFHEGRVFLDKDMQFQLGECTEVGLPEGIDRAIKRFRGGERSLVHFKSKWGYGKHGNKEFSIPPNAELDFDINLTSFDKAKDSWAMDENEKLEEAEKLKQRGTQFFQQGKIRLAVAKYQRIIDLLQFETNYSSEDAKEKKAKRDAIYHAAELNVALCCMKQNDWVDVIKHTEKVLEEDPLNVKALYRRGMAHQGMGNFEDAIRDFSKALDKEPENKAAIVKMGECRKKIAEHTQKEKQLFANMFDKFAQADQKKQAQISEENRKKAFGNIPPPKPHDDSNPPEANGGADQRTTVDAGGDATLES